MAFMAARIIFLWQRSVEGNQDKKMKCFVVSSVMKEVPEDVFKTFN